MKRENYGGSKKMSKAGLFLVGLAAIELVDLQRSHALRVSGYTENVPEP